jgi:hypothetical protein
MWANFGEIRNGQAKIVAASARGQKKWLQHTLDDPRDKQAFDFSEGDLESD